MRSVRWQVAGAWCVVCSLWVACPSPPPDFQTPTPDEEESPTPIEDRGIYFTEVMANPEQVSDSKGEWIELYNETGEEMDLEGWTLTEASGSEVALDGLIVPAGEYVVLGPNSKTEDNGGVELDLSYDPGFSISNDAETLSLHDSDGALVDVLTYPAAPRGASLSLDPSRYGAAGNDDLANLCATLYSTYGSGDYGTPGKGNDPCFVTASEGDIIISEIMANPAAAEDERGIFIEIYNLTSEAIRMDGWVVQDGAGDKHTISSGGDLEIEAGDFLVLGAHFEMSENGGVTLDYSWSRDLVFSNSADTVSLYAGETLVDAVSYGSGDFPETPEGASLQLDPTAFNATDNDSGANWCASTAEIVEGKDKGTPGVANTSCGP